ncbi:type II toxin-antitoxin system HicB family antitoxin [Belliella marina]|uniref:Type II toxin-antitoxin system HicB family antitoxin n=1 Tax=Belliella marina TaxID=1644146 RepID=A0ABW4VIZ3_9BACT
MEKIKVQITWLDNYGAYSEVVPGCVATNDTFEGVKESYREALEFHLEGMKEDGDEIPELLKGEYELEFEANTQALLKLLDGKVTRAALARVTGINERQLGHYITGRVTPRPSNREKVLEGVHKLGEELLSVV